MKGFSYWFDRWSTGITLLVLVTCVGCTTSRPGLSNLNSTAWMQTSEEYRALSISAYNIARQRLDEALADKSWTAVPEQVPGNSEETAALARLPPAIILDVDETVLNTLPYQTWLVKHDEQYSSLSWNSWVREANAEAVPGALAFVSYVMEKGVRVFYLSNRDYRGKLDIDRDGIIESHEEHSVLKQFTIANLVRLGFLPQEGVTNEDSVLLQGELTSDGQVKKGWGASDKTARRLYLASRYRILLLLGDGLVDFIGYRAGDSHAYEDMYRGFKQDRTAREAELNKHQDRWGESWILLPNPIYGSWERDLYGFGDSSSTEKKIDMKLDRLDSWK